jgi:hypothetical protein
LGVELRRVGDKSYTWIAGMLQGMKKAVTADGKMGKERKTWG